jgi:hypothetical protein
MTFIDIKKECIFLDETFVKSSNVRRDVNVQNTKLLRRTHLSGDDHRRLSKERTSFYRKVIRVSDRQSPRFNEVSHIQFVSNPQATRFKEVGRILNDAEIDIEPSIDNYKFVYPLSKKTVIQYDEKKHDLIAHACERQDTKEKQQVKILRDGELVDYCKTIKPSGKHTLKTKLSPYYDHHQLSVEEVIGHNELVSSKLIKSAENAQRNGQRQRQCDIMCKIRKLKHLKLMIFRLARRFDIYGRKLKGVKAEINVAQKFIPWPKVLIGSFKTRASSISSWHDTILHTHTVSILQSGEVPALQCEGIHIFCEDVTQTSQLIKSLSQHELNKFRAFSHFGMKMSPEYPFKNSIGFLL